MKLTAVTIALIAALPMSAQVNTQMRQIQAPERASRQLGCDSRNFNQRNMLTHCEMREQTVGFGGRLTIDGGGNGGVTIKGTDRSDVLVRAKVEGAAPDDLGAKAIVSQIFIEASAGNITARGPQIARNESQNWNVEFEILVPRHADLQVKANNGGIGISDVSGRIEFETRNGGVSLTRLGGDVQGSTANGGLTVTLAGSRWEGTKLDVRTSNGGVTINMPENYSANLETGTVNGGMHIDFPVTVRGEVGKRLNTVIGSGGPLIRVETTNGGVNVRRTAL